MPRPISNATSKRVARRLLLWAPITLSLPIGSLSAQPLCMYPHPWTRVSIAQTPAGGPLSPLQVVPDPTVVHDGPVYKMWFTNANSKNQTGIAYAQSLDGLSWTVYHNPVSPDPIMDLVLIPPAGAWDSPGIETANVLRSPNGGYLLYFAGDHSPQGSVTYAIGLATSPDGIHWTQRAAPVLEAQNDWEQPICTTPGNLDTCSMGGVLEPSVLYDASTKQYKMWYVGLGQPADSFRTFRVGYAVSIDGISWQRRAKPVFALGTTGAWDEMWTSQINIVGDPKAGYHMFYFGSAPKDYRDGIEMQRGSIGHAYSADGITWQRDPANPILSPRPRQLDAWSLGGPSALVDGNQIKLWYFASPTSGLLSSVVLASAPCGP